LMYMFVVCDVMRLLGVLEDNGRSGWSSYLL
jgi:hypothetical protein